MYKESLDNLVASAAIFKDGLVCSTRAVGGDEAWLFPVERAAVARAVPSRRAEFTAGRAAAREALGRIGVAPVAIPVGADRAPVWPGGVIGSITHTAGLCVAVAARLRHVAAIGVDLEQITELSDALIPRIARPEEIALLRRDPPGIAALRILSLKEAAYKAQYSLSQMPLDFAALTLTADGLVFAFPVPPFPQGYVLPVRQWTNTGLCLSLCTLLAPPSCL